MTQHELILVLDVRVDEVAEKPALDAIVWLRWIVGRSVRQATTDQPMSIIAATGLSLSRDRLTSWIDTPHVRPNGAAQTLGISRPVGVYVLEVVQPIESNPAGRAIRIRRQCKGNAIAPSSTYLGGKQVRMRLSTFRLQDMLA